MDVKRVGGGRGATGAIVCMAVGVALLAEGLLAVRFRVGTGGAFGVGRAAMLLVGGALTLGGFALFRRAPISRPGTQLWRVARASWPLLVALAVYLSAFFVLNPAATGDQPHYEVAALNLAYDQSRNVTAAYRDPLWTFVAYPGGGLSPHGEAHYYAHSHELMLSENVGLPLVLAAGVPWVQLAFSKNVWDAHWPWNIEMILLAAIAAHLLYRLLARLRPREPALTSAVWLCTVFCAPMLVYANEIYPEVPMMLLALIVADCLTRKPSTRCAVVGSFAAAAMPWFHVRYFLVAVLLEVALVLRTGARARAHDRHGWSLTRAVAPVLAPFLASLAGLAVAFQAWYGSPLITAPYGIASEHQAVTALRAYNAFAQLFVGAHTAALPFAPVGLLALTAVPLFCRRYGRWALFALLVAGVYILTVVVEGTTIGDSFPGRYTVWLIPFGSVPLLFVVSEYRIARVAFAPLAALTGWIAISVVLQPLGTAAQTPARAPIWAHVVNLWPRLNTAGFTDLGAVAAWSALVLVGCAAVYFAGTLRPRPRPRLRVPRGARA